MTPDVRLIFLPLKTPAHLTNYKPDFMLQVEALAAYTGTSSGGNFRRLNSKRPRACREIMERVATVG